MYFSKAPNTKGAFHPSCKWVKCAYTARARKFILLLVSLLIFSRSFDTIPSADTIGPKPTLILRLLLETEVQLCVPVFSLHAVFWAYHMDKSLECSALSREPGTAKDCMLGVLEDDGFTVYPTAGTRRCLTGWPRATRRRCRFRRSSACRRCPTRISAQASSRPATSAAPRTPSPPSAARCWAACTDTGPFPPAGPKRPASPASPSHGQGNRPAGDRRQAVRAGVIRRWMP